MCRQTFNTFAAKRGCSRIYRSLPNRDYSRNLRVQLIADIFNRYKGHNVLLFISKCSGGIIISYMEVSAILCTRMDFTNMFKLSLDFAEIKNIENMSMGMTYRTH